MVGALNSLGKVERAAERALNLFRLSREGDRIGSAIAQSLRAALYPVLAPEEQGWTELEEGDFLLPWLLHITRYELCERPCCAPFRLPKS